MQRKTVTFIVVGIILLLCVWYVRAAPQGAGKPDRERNGIAGKRGVLKLIEDLKKRVQTLENRQEIHLRKVILSGDDLVFVSKSGKKAAALVYMADKSGFDWNIYNKRGKIITKMATRLQGGGLVVYTNNGKNVGGMGVAGGRGRLTLRNDDGKAVWRAP